VSLTDAGGYYCKAVNRYGRATVRVHLNVRGYFLLVLIATVVFSSDGVNFLTFCSVESVFLYIMSVVLMAVYLPCFNSY